MQSYNAIAIADYIPQENDSADYLSFQQDDDLIINTFYENGWCFGARADDPSLTGFIPMNHIYVIPEAEDPEEDEEEEPQQQINKSIGPTIINQQENKQPQKVCMKTIQKQKKDKKWMSYVNGLLEDNSVLNQMLNNDAERGDQFLPFAESTAGYENFQPGKKVKMAENTNVKPEPFISAGGRQDLALFSLSYEQNVPKQYRDLKYYFDYDRWVEWVNETGCIPKGKPDAKKKKPKLFHLKLREFKF